MIQIVWITFFLVINVGCSEPNNGKQNPYVHYDIDFNEVAPTEVYQAASKGIPTFLGVQSSQVSLGTAFRNYYIQEAARSNCNPPNVVWLLAYYSDMWRIIATVDGTTSYLIDMYKTNDEWKVASSTSAQSYMDLMQQLKALYPEYKPIYIWSYEGESFFYFPELNDTNLTWIEHYPLDPSELQNIKSLSEAMAYMNPACAGK